MYRQDFRVLLLYHLCSLCSLPLEESQVLGGVAGRQGALRHAAGTQLQRNRAGKGDSASYLHSAGLEGPIFSIPRHPGSVPSPSTALPQRSIWQTTVSPLLTLRVPTSLWIHKDMTSALYLCITLQAYSIQKICHKRHEYWTACSLSKMLPRCCSSTGPGNWSAQWILKA